MSDLIFILRPPWRFLARRCVSIRPILTDVRRDAVTALPEQAAPGADRSPESGSSEAEELRELMIAYQAGDLGAFDELYSRLSPGLRRYLLSLTRDVTRAEDLLQESFLQIHRSRHTYAPPRPVSPWAFGIARHVFLMARRAGMRRGRHETDAGEAFPEIPVPARDGEVAHRDELRRAIAVLSPERREPLLLHHVWGFSFKEIGGMLGIREGAAKVRAHRAMESLRAVIGGAGAS